MMTKGKVIVEAPDGKRYVITGIDTRVVQSKTRGGKDCMILDFSSLGFVGCFKLREVKRDVCGRKVENRREDWE